MINNLINDVGAEPLTTSGHGWMLPSETNSPPADVSIRWYY